MEKLFYYTVVRLFLLLKDKKNIRRKLHYAYPYSIFIPIFHKNMDKIFFMHLNIFSIINKALIFFYTE